MNYRTWTILFGPDSAILPGIAGRTGDQDHFPFDRGSIMNRLWKGLLAAWVILGMLGSQFTFAKAAEPTYNPNAEAYVLAQLRSTGAADLAAAFRDATQRVIRGEFIVELFEHPDLQDLPFIKIYNATILGDIQADGLTIPFGVTFDHCEFTGKIELSSTRMRTFLMYNSHAQGSVRLGRAVIEEDLSLYESVYDSAVILFGAYVGGNLVLSTAVFENTANFKDVHVGNFLNAQSVVFNRTVTFESGMIDRDADFSDAVFENSVNFDFFTAARFLKFDGAAFRKDLSFRYSEAGWVDFSGAAFDDSIDLTGIQVANDLDFSGITYAHPVDPFAISQATVSGMVVFTDVSAPAGIRLNDDRFGNIEISSPGQDLALIDLTGSTVSGKLYIHDVNVQDLYAVEFTADTSTTFADLHVSSTLDMSNASIGYFNMDVFTWPSDPEVFNLRGMDYADIGMVNNDLTDETWIILLAMLDQSAYSPQAYQTLGTFLTEKGHPDWAAEVEVARKVRERDTILAPRSAPWFWSWFLYLFSGYGQRPVLAFIWSALVVGIGALVYRKKDDMRLVDPGAIVPTYNPILYSFDLFLPYIELGIAAKWDPAPERQGAWLYKYVHQLLGWILMPIALLTFGGIIG